MGRKLYVGNLPYEIGEAELQELFARAGNVETISVMRDAATGRARGFAFVEMSSDEEAARAIPELNRNSADAASRSTRRVRSPRSAVALAATADAGGKSRAGKHHPTPAAGIARRELLDSLRLR